MIPRRNLVTGGLLGGVLGALGSSDDVEASPAPAAGAGGAGVTEEMVTKIVNAIVGLRTEVQGLKAFPEIAPIRDAQLTHPRANGKFPHYIEGGTHLLFAIHAWHG